MSRLSRAWRELRKPDPAWGDEPQVHFDLYGASVRDLRGPLTDIAASLKRIERRKRRPRIVLCEHPELHPEIEMGVGVIG